MTSSSTAPSQRVQLWKKILIGLSVHLTLKKVSITRIGSFPSVAKPVVLQAVHRCGGGGPHDKYFRGVGAETEPRSFGVESRSVSTRFYYLLLGWEKALYVDKFNKMKCI